MDTKFCDEQMEIYPEVLENAPDFGNSNDVIIDSLHNPNLQVIVLGHVTPYKL